MAVYNVSIKINDEEDKIEIENNIWYNITTYHILYFCDVKVMKELIEKGYIL